MRDLLLGILLGIWITTVQAWVERHKMFSLSDILFYLLTLAIVVLLAWRPIILPLIGKIWPELWLKLTDFNPALDRNKVKAEIAERKAKREAMHGSNKDGSHNSGSTDNG